MQNFLSAHTKDRLLEKKIASQHSIILCRFRSSFLIQWQTYSAKTSLSLRYSYNTMSMNAILFQAYLNKALTWVSTAEGTVIK